MIGLAILSLAVWLYLVLLHGRFWQAGPVLAAASPKSAPPVCVIVPARDEAAVIARSVGSLLAQDYAGPLRVVLVDDNSDDGTAAIAAGLAGADRLTILQGRPRPAGWAGKLWAVHQGIDATDEEMLLLTDADIAHDPGHVATLVAAIEDGSDMVSEMVSLHCESLAERALVPAFVYFFALLYPFAWVNDPLRATAAAAGGTVLIRRRALARTGGIAAIRTALIDDVALARAVKRGGRIRLAHSTQARSIRPYPRFADIWTMVTRSAYVQLRNSPALLVLTTLGLALVFLVPPLAALAWHSWSGALAWALMAGSFWPTLHRFGRSPLWAPALPLIALFYMAATIGAAWNYHRGRGVVWKSRAYGQGHA
ncbi:MAG: glycosyltransferase [Rhodospirillales bacterium]|nr:glycosyltransferase [Rhodospirillales bacterium]